MRQLKKGAGKEEPLVRMEAGRSRSLELVTGDQFAAGSRLVTKQAILLSNLHTKITVHNFNSAFIRGSLQITESPILRPEDSALENQHFAQLKGFSPV